MPSNLADWVGSGQEVFKSHGSGRVGSDQVVLNSHGSSRLSGFHNLAGGVGSIRNVSKFLWVGSGKLIGSANPTGPDSTN